MKPTLTYERDKPEYIFKEKMGVTLEEFSAKRGEEFRVADFESKMFLVPKHEQEHLRFNPENVYWIQGNVIGPYAVNFCIGVKNRAVMELSNIGPFREDLHFKLHNTVEELEGGLDAQTEHLLQKILPIKPKKPWYQFW